MEDVLVYCFQSDDIPMMVGYLFSTLWQTNYFYIVQLTQKSVFPGANFIGCIPLLVSNHSFETSGDCKFFFSL